MLNAKQHASEAHIVAQAGRKGAVTVATNMAGRGTDIMLGGSVEFLADEELRRQGLDPTEHSDEYEAAWPAMVEKIKEQVEAEHDEVNDAGGLYVIGTERHESRRIDNQLRGRSGRQGDPGESRFYLSLEDDLMRLFKSDWVDWVLTTMKIPDDVPIENKRVTGAIASAQAQVESQNFETRKNILKYDDVMSRQREVIYGERRQVLEGADLQEQIREHDRRHHRGLRHRSDRGLPGGVGPRRSCGPRSRRSTRCRSAEQQIEDEAGGVDGPDREFARGGAQGRRARGVRRSRGGARRRGACASSSGACCCRCSTASGASTSTRWTTCARASGCGRTRSATRWSSTSARASTCSAR